MLTCVNRIRNNNGVITHYVFDNGNTVEADKVRDKLKKRPKGLISNLKLSSDGKIIMAKVVSHIVTDNKKMHKK